MSDCRSVEPDLLPWRTGDLPPARADEVASHLSRCGACAAFLDDAVRVLGHLRRLPEIELRPESMERLGAMARRLTVRSGLRRSRPLSASTDRGGLLSGAAIGLEYLRFQLRRRRSLRIFGAIAAALVLHALAFAALRGVRGPSAPIRPAETRVSSESLPAQRQEVVIIDTLDAGAFASPLEIGEPDLSDPELFVSYRDSVARQTTTWNSRSLFRLDAAVRLDPEARRRVFAALGDPEGVEEGIDRGLDYLASVLRSEERLAVDATPDERAALSALSALAFLGRGSSDSYGPHREACAFEAERLLELISLDGGAAERADPMIRALALWALAENSALSVTRFGAEGIQRAIESFASEQRADGGWSATAGGLASDPLVSAVVASSLAIAARSGFSVPDPTAASFAGGFALPRLRDLVSADPEVGRESSPGAADASLLLALELWRPIDGRLSPPDGASAVVERQLVSRVTAARTDLLLFERGLLALQLGSLPEGAQSVHGALARRILEAQAEDGGVDPSRFEFDSSIGRGRAVATALAVLLLEVPCRYRSRT